MPQKKYNYSVSLIDTTNSTSIGTGSFQTSGGAAFGKNISIGAKVNIFGGTSGSVSIASPATIATPYTLTLPSSLPGSAGMALVSDLTGNLSYTAVGFSAGTGLSLAGTTFSVNPLQSQITQVGTLTSLGVSGLLNATGNIQIGSGGGSGFGYIISQDAAHGMYVRLNATGGYATALYSYSNIELYTGQTTLSSQTLRMSINNSGLVTIPTATDSSSSTSGAFQVTGGVGIGKSLYVGGLFSLSNAAPASSYLATLFHPNLAVGSYNNIGFGVSNTAYNLGSIAFNYVGASSTANYVIIAVPGQSAGLTLAGTGVVTVQSTADSTSTTTGALQVAGGVGIGKSVFIGNTINVGNTTSTSAYNALNITGNATNYVQFNMVNTSLANAGFSFAVCGSAAQATYVGNGGFYVWSNILSNFCFGWKSSGETIIPITTDSTSIASGALQIAGGVGIAKSLYLGGVINATASINGGYNTFFKNSSAGSGAYNIIGLQNDTSGVYLFINSSTRTGDGGVNTATLRNDVGDLTLQGASGGGLTGIRIYGTSNNVAILTTTDSSSSTTGALQVFGGVGISKSLYVGGNFLRFNNTDNSAFIFGAASQETLGFVKQLGTGPKICSASGANIVLSYSNQTALATNIGGSVITDVMTVGSGGVNILNTTDSSSTTTGALQVAGGVGIAKSLFVGTGVYTGTTGFGVTATALEIGDSVVSARWRVQNGDYNLNFLQNNGSGTYIQRSYISNSTGAFTGPIVATTATVSDTTDSSATTGALQVAGGARIAKSAFIGGLLRVASTAADLYGHILVDRVNSGGLGGTITIRNSAAGTTGNASALAFEIDGSTAFDAAGGAQANAEIRCINESGTGGNPGALSFSSWNGTAMGERMRISGVGLVSISNSTDSTSTTTGALQIAGGVGIGKGLYVVGNIVQLGNIYGDTTPRLYPPVSLPGPGTVTLSNTSVLTNAAYGNGTYVTSQSSWPSSGWHFINAVSGGGPYSSDNRYNGSGAYTGSSSTTIGGTAYTGEWVQIQYPYAVSVKTWSWTPRTTSGAPATFVIAGSNDGVTWTSLFVQSTALTLATWATTQTFAVNSSLHYIYYRFVIQSNLGYAFTDSTNQNIFATRENVLFSNTTDSTSTTTGALQVAGGGGIAKNLTVGGSVNVLGTSIINSSMAGPYLYVEKQAALQIVSRTNNGGTTLAAAEPVLTLTRAGVSNQSNNNAASFYLSRYSNATTDAFSQLDIGIHNNWASTFATVDLNVRVLSLRGDGVVSVLGTSFFVGGMGSGLLKTASSVSDYTLLGTNVTDGTANTRIVLSGSTRGQTPGSITNIAVGSGYHEWLTSGVTQMMKLDNTGALTVSGNIVTGGFMQSTASDLQIRIVPGTASSARHYLWNRGASGGAWVFGQPSGTDNDFVHSTNVGSTYTELMRLGFTGGMSLNASGGVYTKYYGKSQTTNYWNVGNEAGSANGQGAYVIYCYAGATCVGGAYLPWGATAWSGYSDRRLKKEINLMNDDSSLNAINRLNPVSYKWNADEDDAQKKYGLIAQEVAEVIPEIVTIGKDNMLGVAYPDLIPFLIGAIKELKSKNEAFEARLRKLEAP